MANLFQEAKSTINEHIKNIYKEGELKQELTMRKFGNSEFSTKPTIYFNLDVEMDYLDSIKELDTLKGMKEKKKWDFLD